MPRKDDRLNIAPLGEVYEDLLTADSNINARSVAVQASSLLCAKLQERESRIKERVQYLANKRGISYEDCWKQCVTGTLEKITPEEWAEMPGKED